MSFKEHNNRIKAKNFAEYITGEELRRYENGTGNKKNFRRLKEVSEYGKKINKQYKMNW